MGMLTFLRASNASASAGDRRPMRDRVSKWHCGQRKREPDPPERGDGVGGSGWSECLEESGVLKLDIP